MAQHRLATNLAPKFIDKRKASAGSTTTGVTSGVGTPANYATIGAMDTRLAAISALYTQARLDSMTVWDKMYALQVLDDSATL